MHRKIPIIPGIFMILALVLSACATATSAPTQAPAEPEVTEESQPAATEPPAEPTPLPAEEPVATEETAPAEPLSLILATTTSTEDSGLLDYILPNFQEEFNITVEVIAVGTGQALQLGTDGNADVLLVHARAREDEFMAAGDGVRREDVMYNDFVIVGPENDPAGIAGMSDAAAAFTKIAETQSPFISRGDDSGTHSKEKSVWKATELEPAGDWYISAGQGMGAVLTMADEQLGYTLSDRATYLALTLEGTDLKLLVEGDPILFNPYGVIAVNPDKGPHIKNDLANTFIDWLVSLPTQELIATFGVKEFGAPLFTPDSPAWRAANPAEETSGMEAALKLTGMVEQEMGWSEGDVQAMEIKTVQYTDKNGETLDYDGVSIMPLLELAKVQSGAATVVFVADDGFTGEVSLEELQACEDCIVAFEDQGGFRIVMPGFPGNVQVKGVIEIQVK